MSENINKIFDWAENVSFAVTVCDSKGYVVYANAKSEQTFASNGDVTEVVESFEAENQNPIEMLQGGWQAILNSFKAHTEKI